MVSVTRYHDFSCGHTVTGHEGGCRHLHGHNYRIHFTCQAPNLDALGRVVDFSVLKTALCEWIEHYWDHRFLVWENDVRASALCAVDPFVVKVPFNPTAENMAEFLVERVGPNRLAGTPIVLVEVRIEETRKCSATYRRAP